MGRVTLPGISKLRIGASGKIERPSLIARGVSENRADRREAAQEAVLCGELLPAILVGTRLRFCLFAARRPRGVDDLINLRAEPRTGSLDCSAVKLRSLRLGDYRLDAFGWPSAVTVSRISYEAASRRGDWIDRSRLAVSARFLFIAAMRLPIRSWQRDGRFFPPSSSVPLSQNSRGRPLPTDRSGRGL